MRRIDAIEPFRVMQLLERARQLEAQGRDIVHMEIGEPDLPTPPAVTEAARAWLAEHNAAYTPSTGEPKLQHALSAWYGREYGLTIEPARFLITPGTSGAFSLIYAALLDPKESVLLPDPGYPCQRNFVRLAGGEPLPVPVGPDTGYHLDRNMVESNWQAGTRAAVVISPGNPTGTLIDAGQLAGLTRACRERGGHLISDEIYHGLTYGRRADCALAFDDEAIVVNGFSKRWAMTGWRLGYAVLQPGMREWTTKIVESCYSSSSMVAQRAAMAAPDRSDAALLLEGIALAAAPWLMSLLGTL